MKLRKMLKAVSALALLCLVLSACATQNTQREEQGVDIPLPGETASQPHSVPQQSEASDSPDFIEHSGDFELPIYGASGYASIELAVYAQPDTLTEPVATLVAGQAFMIIEEADSFLHIQVSETSGYILKQYAMINLPDVLPSIICKNTNSYASIMRSSGFDIPQITGLALYDALAYNERYHEEQHIIPVLYEMAKKIAVAQNTALSEGNTLVIYEGFRPNDVQQKIVQEMVLLTQSNEQVLQGVSQEPWSMHWFIAQGVSSHQQGYAIDVSLARVLESEQKHSGNYLYTKVVAYEEYVMPSAMHELSTASIRLQYPASAQNDDAWRTAPLASSMTDGAILLQGYCSTAGLTPLASEWWHFNDLQAREQVSEGNATGDYHVTELHSVEPIY